MSGGGYLGNAATFLIETLFGFFILATMARLLLQWVRADFYNPLAQFVVRITNPILRPLRRLIPGYGGIDLAALLLAFLLQLIELILVALIIGRSPGLIGLLLITLSELFSLMVWIFIISILVEAVMSWIGNTGYNPVSAILYRLNEPLLSPARRLLPPIAGIDLSPIAVLIVLQLMLLLIAAPLHDIGWGVAAAR